MYKELNNVKIDKKKFKYWIVRKVFHNIVIALSLNFRNSSLSNSKSNNGPKNLLQKSKSHSSSYSR